MSDVPSSLPQTIRIPRIAIAPPTSHLTGSGYLSPVHGTMPRHTTSATYNPTYAPTNIYTPSYIVDHLPSRRLSEIDSPFYLPSLTNNNQSNNNNGLLRSGYSTTPLRIRTDPNSARYVDTSTDHRQPRERRERAATSNEYREQFRLSNYPATATAIGTAKLPRLHVESTPPIPFNYIATTPSPVILPENETRQEEIVAETNEEVSTLALFNNTSLAYQRICFLLSRYPAVALTIVSIWMLWGRGLGLTTVNNNENVAYIVSFTAGVFILIGQIVLSSSHHNNYKTAKTLANLYHFSNIVGILICLTSVVFAAISYQNVQNSVGKTQTCSQTNTVYMNSQTGKCFTPNERIVFLSVLIGSSSLIVLLFLFSGIYGCVGQSLMKKKRQDEFRKFAQAHDNASFRF